MRKGSMYASGASVHTVLTRKPTPLTRTRPGLAMRKGSTNFILSLLDAFTLTLLTRPRPGLAMCKGSM